MDDYIIEVQDIERELERKIVTALRFLFSMNKRFRYSSDPKETKVVIGVDYPEGDTPLKIPHICVGGITYSFNMESSLYQNYAKDIWRNGVKVGEARATQIPFTYQVSCYGERNLSRDLANAALSNLTFIGITVFNSLGTRTLRADKGNTTPYAQFPNVFVTPVSCSSIMDWCGEVVAIDETQLNILKKIEVNFDKEIGGALYGTDRL